MESAINKASSIIDRNESTINIKITPWRDADEFDEVGRLLLRSGTIINFNQDDQQKMQAEIHRLRNALRQVIVWRARSVSNQLPYTVESTACLAELLLRDHDASNSVASASTTSYSSSASQMELRLAYSSAIIRGVNGIAGSLQQRRGLDRANALSVATLCKRLGLPGWVVDMRHDAAHAELPTLPCLRMAAKTLLEFFSALYWTPHYESRMLAKEQALELLFRYKALTKAIIAKESNAAKKSTIGGCNINTQITSSSSSKNVLKSSSLELPITYAKKFVTSVTADVGIPLAVKVLIRGVESATSDTKGFLVPRSIETTDEGFSKICHRYKTLLVTIQHSWSGFLHALIVDAVDSIIQMSKQDNYSCSVSSGDKGAVMVSSQRKLFFLMSWVRYFTSQSFLSDMSGTKMLLGRPVSSTQSRTIKHVKIDPQFISLINIPFNSMCDRLCSEEVNRNCHEIKVLLSIFETILGIARVENKMTKQSLNSPTSSPRKRSLSPDTKKSSNMDDLNGKKKVAASPPDPMSLEVMEEMLLSTDEEDDSSSGSCAECFHEDIFKDDSKSQEAKQMISSPWSRCATWDSCAIGSIPGQPPLKRGFY